MIILSEQEILARLQKLDLIDPVEEALRSYSNGDANCPPPGEMLFENPSGEVHIKFAHTRDSPFFVIKVANGFPANAQRGLPTSDGMMLLFARDTGEPVALLEDRGHLTNLRTAAAGAVCAKYLAPTRISVVGVLGAGIQAELQVRLLAAVRPFDAVVLWARNAAAAQAYQRRLAESGVAVRLAATPRETARLAEIVITATAAESPLLEATDIRPGQHITAVGADSEKKNELAPDLVGAADCLVVDSLSQCAVRGDLAHALAAGTRDLATVFEIGAVANGTAPGRQEEGQTSVALLTGLAVQDLAACRAVFEAAGDLLAPISSSPDAADMGRQKIFGPLPQRP